MDSGRVVLISREVSGYGVSSLVVHGGYEVGHAISGYASLAEALSRLAVGERTILVGAIGGRSG